MATAILYSINHSNLTFYQKSLSKLQVKTTCVSYYPDFERFLLSDLIDLIIMDLELDNTDAITVIKEIKLLKLKRMPYIMVCSSKSDDYIEISAFNSGADDFVDLPINPTVFESKLKSLIKHTDPAVRNTAYGSIHIDQEKYQILINEKAHSLPRLEFRLASLLFSNPNKIFSKDEIANEIWHNKEISSKRTIDIHIRNIRRALGDDVIKTYRGIGYSMKIE